MENASGAVLSQTVIMFIILIIGIICYKTKLINDEGKKQLSSLVLYVVNPLLIFLSYQTDLRAELLEGLLWVTVMAAATYAVFIALSLLLFRKKVGRDVSVERFAAVYSNCAFMGTPLIFGVYGSDGVFLQNGFITVFNLLVWTHGLMTVKGGEGRGAALKAVTTPAVISVALGMVCFFAGLRIPEIPLSALNSVAEMTTPLAMIVAGASIAGSDIVKSLKNPRVYLVSLVRLAVFPLIGMLIIALFPASETAKLITLIEISCPTAAIGMMFAIRYGKNAQYCSQIFAVSTLASMVTLPLAVWLGTVFL